MTKTFPSYRWALLPMLLMVCNIHITRCLAQASYGSLQPAEMAAHNAIERAMQSHIEMNYADRTLADVATALGRRVGIDFLIDHRALAEEHLDASLKVNLTVSHGTLRTALDWMLEQVKLTWIIRGQVVVITTPEAAEYHLETRAYAVRDLVQVPHGDGVALDFDSLIELITTTVDPDSWDEVGGAGSIAPLENALALVISQSRVVHEKIERVLTALRRIRNAQGIRAAGWQFGEQAVQLVASWPIAASPQPSGSRPTAQRYTPIDAKWRVPRLHK